MTVGLISSIQDHKSYTNTLKERPYPVQLSKMANVASLQKSEYNFKTIPLLFENKWVNKQVYKSLKINYYKLLLQWPPSGFFLYFSWSLFVSKQWMSKVWQHPIYRVSKFLFDYFLYWRIIFSQTWMYIGYNVRSVLMC